MECVYNSVHNIGDDFLSYKLNVHASEEGACNPTCGSILIVLLIAVCQHHFLTLHLHRNTAAWTTCKVLVLSGCTEP